MEMAQNGEFSSSSISHSQETMQLPTFISTPNANISHLHGNVKLKEEK